MRHLLSILFTSPLFAAVQVVSLQWDPNPEPDIAAYAIHWGTEPRIYTASTNVGNVTRASIVLPGDIGITSSATSYLAVTAINLAGLESDFSRELTNIAPIIPPQNAVLCSGIESADSLDGPWTEVLSTHLPITIQSNKFYRPKLEITLAPPPTPK